MNEESFKTYTWQDTPIHVHNAIACNRSTLDIWRFLKTHCTAAIRCSDQGTEPRKRCEREYNRRSDCKWVFRRVDPDGSIVIWPATMPPHAKRPKNADERTAQMIALAEAGKRQMDIAAQLGVSPALVSRTLNPRGFGRQKPRRRCDGVGL